MSRCYGGNASLAGVIEAIAWVRRCAGRKSGVDSARVAQGRAENEAKGDEKTLEIGRSAVVGGKLGGGIEKVASSDCGREDRGLISERRAGDDGPRRARQIGPVHL